MKRSTQLASLALASLAVLAIPALAQSSGSTPGSSADKVRPPTATPGSNATPSSGSVSGSSTEPYNPTSSGSSVNRPSSPNSGSDRVSPDLDSSTPRASSNANPVGVLNSNFAQIDSDTDGRISLTEFTQLSSTGSTTSGSSVATAGRSDSTTGVTSGSLYTPEQFRLLDSDHDGYLTRAELNASSNNMNNPSTPQNPAGR
jgi:hypothetical protein